MLHNSNFVGFAQGTLVLMANGQWKPIEYIKEGESVLSFDPKDKELDFSPKTVTATFSYTTHECIQVTSNDRVTIVGRDQLFFTPSFVWAKGYETKAIMDYEKSPATVDGKRVKNGKWKIYDIEVEDNHTLIADGLLAHNKNNFKDLPKGNPGKTNDTKAANTSTPIISTPTTPGATPQIIGYTKPAEKLIGGPVRPSAVVAISTQPALVSPSVIPNPPQNSFIAQTASISSGISAIGNKILSEDKGGTKFAEGDVKKFQMGKDKTQDLKQEIKSEIKALDNLLATAYSAPGVPPVPGAPPGIYQDPTLVLAAQAELRDMKKDLKKGKPIKQKPFVQSINTLNNLMTGIRNQIPGQTLPPPPPVDPVRPPVDPVKPVDPIRPPPPIEPIRPKDPIIIPIITQPIRTCATPPGGNKGNSLVNPVVTNSGNANVGYNGSITVSPVINNNIVNPPPVLNLPAPVEQTAPVQPIQQIFNFPAPTPPVSRPVDAVVCCPPPHVRKPPFRPRPIAPTPSSYATERVYQSDVNFAYFIQAPAGNRYYYDPPNAPASANLSWYKHYDSDRGQYYYDRVSSGGVGVDYNNNSILRDTVYPWSV